MFSRKLMGDRQNSQTPIYPNPNPTVWVPQFPETPPKIHPSTYSLI